MADFTAMSDSEPELKVFGVGSSVQHVQEFECVQAPRDVNKRDVVFRFIDLVRTHPEIWDVRSMPYRNKELKKQSFTDIGAALGWSENDAVKKFNNLRTYYTKEVIRERRSGNESRWPYFTKLDQFLRKTVHARQPGSKWANVLVNKSTPELLGNRRDVNAAGTSAMFRKRRNLIGLAGAYRRNFHNQQANTATETSPPPTTQIQTSQATPPSLPPQPPPPAPPPPQPPARPEDPDMLFAKLIASQLGKIKEGLKKEQLKINLQQQIVQAMFEEEHAHGDPVEAGTYEVMYTS